MYFIKIEIFLKFKKNVFLRGFKYCVRKTSVNRGAPGTLSDLCHQSFRQSGPCCSSLLLYQIPWPSRTQLWPAGKLRSVNQDFAFIHFSKSSALRSFGIDLLLFNQNLASQYTMAIWVVKFPRKGYKVKYIYWPKINIP